MREDKFNILTAIEVEFDDMIPDPRYNQWFINNLRCSQASCCSQATFRALVSALRVYTSDYKFRKSTYSFAKKVAVPLYFLASEGGHHETEDECQGRPSRLLDDWLPSCRSTLYENNVSILALLWAHRQRDWDSDDLARTALELKAFDALGFLIEHLPTSALHGLFDAVAGQGQLSLVEALHARGLDCTAEAMDDAAANGHLDVVIFLHEKRAEGCTTEAMDNAAANGHLDVVIFLHEKRAEGCTTEAMDRAAANGHLEVVTFLHEKRSEGCTAEALVWAATNGHLDVVAFLHEKRAENCTTAALRGAVVEGHLGVVRFLVAHRDEGASSDILDILDTAAAKGHLDIVIYLDELGCFACTTAAIDEAAKNGHLDVVDYLLTHRREGGSRDGAPQGAFDHGHMEIVLRLVAAGYPLPSSGSFRLVVRDPGALVLMQLYVAQGVALPSSWAKDFYFSNKEIAEFYFQHAPETTNVAAPSFPFKFCGLDEIQQALWDEDLDLVSELWTRQPELRHDYLLEVVVCNNKSPKALTLLLEAGVGQPRTVAVENIHRRSFEMMKIILPYCLHPNDPIDNLIFLVDWIDKEVRYFTKSPLLLLKAEMIAQATAANCRYIHAGTEIEALTEALLERGATTSYLQPEVRGMQQRVLFKSGIADWGLATLFVHFVWVDATKYVEKLLAWLQKVTDATLKAYLQHVLEQAVTPDAVAAVEEAHQAARRAKWAMASDY
ncbi:hypothetical protein SDRG_10082 [Saprolegnia diclina VS20]|uniref:Uncharacterized protein n=1 Tax=Saprolegnia diclina (strain VS20) TaxID=1156394 RepID=T0QFG5_SAPDV|nr:hypothetical protein SDRG_10082 [Saprolegnia diclina VS20]EQC32335.1 hypothetical protein SDRG_10082 [Saprolegnia diclina VS20]|eukprot:XP_008614276.1 hypothetical protein SDRG_10082 [Saprolegnia diclina VS20]